MVTCQYCMPSVAVHPVAVGCLWPSGGRHGSLPGHHPSRQPTHSRLQHRRGDVQELSANVHIPSLDSISNTRVSLLLLISPRVTNSSKLIITSIRYNSYDKSVNHCDFIVRHHHWQCFLMSKYVRPKCIRLNITKSRITFL